MAKKSAVDHVLKKANELECCRCGNKWSIRGRQYEVVKERWADALMSNFRGECISFHNPVDREHFRTTVIAALDGLIKPRVCPDCKSPWWNVPRRKAVPDRVHTQRGS